MLGVEEAHTQSVSASGQTKKEGAIGEGEAREGVTVINMTWGRYDRAWKMWTSKQKQHNQL